MIIEQIAEEKLVSYRPIYIDRKNGEQQEPESIISLFPSEVINWQVKHSTAKTIVMLKYVVKS